MRTITASLTQEKNKLDMTSAWLPLITVEVNPTTILRLVPNPTNVDFRGETYVAFGLEIDEITQDAKGGLNEVAVSVSNVGRIVSAAVEFNDLLGARVTLLYVNSENLDDPDAAVVEEQYEIMSMQVKGDQFVTFTLGHDRISQHVFPAGKFLRDNCRWIYKSPECGYAGALPSCDKMLEGTNGCRAHANVIRFGGFTLLTPIPGRML